MRVSVSPLLGARSCIFLHTHQIEEMINLKIHLSTPPQNQTRRDHQEAMPPNSQTKSTYPIVLRSISRWRAERVALITTRSVHHRSRTSAQQLGRISRRTTNIIISFVVRSYTLASSALIMQSASVACAPAISMPTFLFFPPQLFPSLFFFGFSDAQGAPPPPTRLMEIEPFGAFLYALLAANWIFKLILIGRPLFGSVCDWIFKRILFPFVFGRDAT